MADKGDTDFLKFFTEDEIKIMTKNALKTDNFKLKEYNVKPASEKPLGFLGVHVKINVKAEVNNEEKELFFFAKKVPSDVPLHLDYALRTRAFYKEIELYKTLYQDIANAQKDPSKATKWCPEYYYSRGSDIFVVEDLSVQGFYMAPERTFLDEDHVRAGLKAMAAMHAGSFILEEKFNAGKVETKSPNASKVKGKKTDLGELYQHLTFETESSDIPGHPGNTFFEAGFKSQLAIVDLLPGYSKEEREIIKKKMPARLRNVLQLVKPSKKYKNVFIHGDLWSNNILFKKDEKGVQAVIIDFQLARYGPPAHDIVMFLYLVQNNEFLRQKSTEMLKYYYQNLREELELNDLDVEKLLPWDVLLESYKDYHELGTSFRVTYYQLILTPSDITSKFLESPELFHKNMLIDRSEMITECFLKDEVCRERVKEAMGDLIKDFLFR